MEIKKYIPLFFKKGQRCCRDIKVHLIQDQNRWYNFCQLLLFKMLIILVVIIANIKLKPNNLFKINNVDYLFNFVLSQHLITTFFKHFDSKLLLYNKRFKIYNYVPKRFKKQSEVYVERARNMLNRGKYRSYAFDVGLLLLLKDFAASVTYNVIPFARLVISGPQTDHSFQRHFFVIIYTCLNLLSVCQEHFEVAIFLLRDGVFLPLLAHIFLFKQS